jgi:uncharacterized protein (DUF58 family)
LTSGRLRTAAALAFVVGVALMIPFDYPLILAAGVFFLLAFVVLGIFGLVTPEQLAGEPEPRERNL